MRFCHEAYQMLLLKKASKKWQKKGSVILSKLAKHWSWKERKLTVDLIVLIVCCIVFFNSILTLSNFLYFVNALYLNCFIHPPFVSLPTGTLGTCQLAGRQTAGVNKWGDRPGTRGAWGRRQGRSSSYYVRVDVITKCKVVFSFGLLRYRSGYWDFGNFDLLTPRIWASLLWQSWKCDAPHPRTTCCCSWWRWAAASCAWVCCSGGAASAWPPSAPRCSASASWTWCWWRPRWRRTRTPTARRRTPPTPRRGSCSSQPGSSWCWPRRFCTFYTIERALTTLISTVTCVIKYFLKLDISSNLLAFHEYFTKCFETSFAKCF